MQKQNFSSKRNAIYKAICNTTSHPSASWIYENLKSEIPDLSLGTVYRNINLFKKQGMVSVICNVDGEERIDGNTKPHPHFVCNKCNRVIDINEGMGYTDNSRELTAKGFVISNRLVIYYGLCPECSKEVN